MTSTDINPYLILLHRDYFESRNARRIFLVLCG